MRSMRLSFRTPYRSRMWSSLSLLIFPPVRTVFAYICATERGRLKRGLDARFHRLCFNTTHITPSQRLYRNRHRLTTWLFVDRSNVFATDRPTNTVARRSLRSCRRWGGIDNTATDSHFREFVGIWRVRTGGPSNKQQLLAPVLGPVRLDFCGQYATSGSGKAGLDSGS